MNNTKRFDGKGELYAKSRPSYAAALFAHMKDVLRIPAGSAFADIGSGTGIFSKQLLESDYRVYGVEPNADMRKKAEEKLAGYAGFTSVEGVAADTRLPDGSVDHVTAAQAYHWFDPLAFREECRRILKPGGMVFIVYNFRDESAQYHKDLAELRRRYSPNFRGFYEGMNNEKCRAFFDGECGVFRADNSVTYDHQSYIARLLSSSYSLSESDIRYAAYLEDAERLFERYSNDGTLVVPTATVAYYGTV